MVGGSLITASVLEMVERLQVETGRIKDVKDLTDNVMVTCPSHKGGNENRPSCGILANDKKVSRDGKIITYKKGMVNCFTCGYVATFPEYVSRILGYQDGGKEGTLWLLRNYASADIEHRELTINFKRGKEDKIEYITEDELQKYRYTHPYMYERGLTDELIEYFDVGYDKETKCLTFPVNDENGKCLFVQRRAVGNKFFKNEKTPKGETLYAIDKVYENIQSIDKLYITEGVLDALTVWKYGGYAVSLLGLVLQPKHLEIIKKLPIRVIVIATDNDEHGIKAMYKIRKQLQQFKILYRVKYPQGTNDLNDFNEEQFKNIELKLF